jgi:hypothetical protein
MTTSEPSQMPDSLQIPQWRLMFVHLLDPQPWNNSNHSSLWEFQATPEAGSPKNIKKLDVDLKKNC